MYDPVQENRACCCSGIHLSTRWLWWRRRQQQLIVVGGGVPQGSAQTVSGTAVKGLLKNAQVTVFELDGSGNRLRSVATATTNEQGEYEAALSAAYQGGLLEVEVAPVPGQTRMLCDASACGSVAKGEELELPKDFKLSAIVAKADGDRVSAPVTAWTTMASKRAKASADRGEDIETAVKEAYYQVQQIVGFDPSKVAAKDVNSLAGASEEEQQAAVMNAVVAELIFKDSVDSDDYLDKFERFTSAIEEDDSFGDANDGFELSGLAVATEQALETASIDDPEVLSKLQTQSAVYEDPANQGGLTATEFDPDNVVDEDASPSEKIENFKQFVAGVRTWATSIEALDTAQLGEVVDVETVEAVFREGPIASLKLAQEIINQSLESVALEPAEISSLLEGASKTIALLDNGVEVGTAELTASDEGGLRFEVVGTVSGEAGTALLPFELAIGTSLSPESVDFNTQTVKAVLADTEVVVNGQVEDGTGSALLRLNDVVARLELANAVNADSSAGYVTDEQLDDAFVGASLKGGLELYAEFGESFAGSFEGRLTRLQEGHRFVFTSSPISVQKLKVGGTFTAASGETFDASVNLNVNNASEFDTFAWLDYSGEVHWVDVELGLDAPQLLERIGVEVDPQTVANEAWLWVSVGDPSVGEVFVNGGHVELDENSIEPATRLAEELLVQKFGEELAGQMELGYYQMIVTDLGKSSLWAEVEFPNLESEESFIDASLTVSAAARNLPDLPDAKVTVTANRNSYRGGELFANLKWNQGQYWIELASDNLDEPELVSGRFYDGYGRELVLKAQFDQSGELSGLTGDAFVNGEDIGDVTLRDRIPVITYTNGEQTEFESLF